MADWLNHAAIAAPRNGTTSHTAVTPSTGTVVAGSAFTPTAGRFLACFCGGAVTSGSNTSVPTAAPTGWTGPTNNQAVNNGGLYFWYKTAAGSDTVTALHNGSNYPAVFDFYEFPAGTTFNKAVAATGVALNGAGPTLSAIGSQPNWLAAVAHQATSNVAGSIGWSAGTELVDTSVGFATTDGYIYGLSALDSSALTSWASTATVATSSGNTIERLVVALSVPAPAVNDSFPFRRNPGSGLYLRGRGR